jgi:acylglycerol lipase
MNQQTSTMRVSDGTILTTRTWKLEDREPKGLIVISHGYGEHSERYLHVAEYFTQQGYALYAADHRGHGHSHGGKLGYVESMATLVNDLKQLIDLAHSQHPTTPLFLLGHSMGALIALYYTIQFPATVKGLVISAAYMTTAKDFPQLLRFVMRSLAKLLPSLPIGPVVDSDVLSRDGEITKAYDNDPYVYHSKVPAKTAIEFVETGDYVRDSLSKITLPILVLHGGEDKLAKPEWSQYVYDHVSSPDKTIKIYESLRHEILNEPEKSRVMADIWVWLAAHGGTAELRTQKPTDS